MTDANPPTIEALQARIAHLKSDLVTVSAQLALACKERDKAEADCLALRVLREQVALQNRELTQLFK